MDDGDKATMELAQAQADLIYMDGGIRTPANIQKERFPLEALEAPADTNFVEKPDPNEQQGGWGKGGGDKP